MKNKWLKAGLLGAVVLGAVVAVAGPDTFFLGLGGSNLSVAASTTVQINTYARVTGFSTTTTNPIGLPQLAFDLKRRGAVTGPDTSEDFAAGRLVMIIQTTGIDASSIPASGAEQETLELGNALVGRWELAEIDSYTAAVDGLSGTMVLTEPLKYNYAANSTQVVSVPQYGTVSVANGAKIEALPWDGESGGVVAFLANGGVNLNSTGSISAAALGGRGGIYEDETSNTTSTGCVTENDDSSDLKLGMKGEGLSSARWESSTPARGRMNLTSGGGGGICASSGGGGGGNGGLGGVGGDTKEQAVQPPQSPRPVGGLGGAPLGYSPLKQLTLGGGGGSGQGAANVVGSDGGNGGGIIFFRATQLVGGSVNASGQAALLSTESGGGGGAGGTISIRLTSTCSTTSILANGGNGGSVNVENTTNNPAPAPGGGGGGGRVLMQAAASDCAISVDAGTAGQTLGSVNNPATERGAKPLAGAAKLPPYAGTVTFLTGGLTLNVPAPTLSSALPSLTNDPTLTVTGTGTRNATLVAYKLRPNTSGVYGKVAQTDIGSSGSFSLEVPLNEGNNSLMFAVEFRGLQGPSTAAQSVQLDTTPPNTSASASLPLPTKETSISFTLSATEAGTFQCRMTLPNQAAPNFGSCPSSHTLTSTGTYTFEARALDDAQNSDPTPAAITFLVDRTRPGVSIKAADPVPPALFTRATTAAFGFESTAPDFSRFECELSWQPAGGGTTTSGTWATCPATHVVSNLVNGRLYTLSVRAVDQAQNETDPLNIDTHSWTVDTDPPDTELLTTPPAHTRLNTAFTFDSSDTSILAGDFECSLDEQDFADCASPYTPNLTVPPGVRTVHKLLVRAEDAAGNVDPSPVSYTWVIDNQKPLISLTALDPRDPSNATSAGFDIDSTSDDVARFECQLSSQLVGGGDPVTGSWTLCPATHVVSNLVNGRRYTLSVKAVDLAQNESDPIAPHVWTVDTDPPDTVLLTMPPAHTRLNTAFTFDSPDPSILDGDFECSLDGQTFADCASPYTPNVTVPPGVRTEHRLLVRAKDAADNVDPSPVSYIWAIDNEAPDTAISGLSPAPPNNPDNSTTAVFGFTTAATDLARFECRLNLAPGDNDWHPCEAAHSISGLVDGTTYTLSVRAVDLAGNEAAFPASHTWRVDTTPLNTLLHPRCIPDELTSLLDAKFIYTASSGEDLSHFECSLDGEPFQRCDLNVPGDPVTSENPNPPCATNYHQRRVADGPHKMLIRAVDTAGNADDSPAAHAWRVESDDVTTEITSQPALLTNSTTATFQFTSNRGNVSFVCKLGDEPTRPCGSITPLNRRTAPQSFENLTHGTYTLRVFAVDTDPEPDEPDENGAAFQWTVDLQPPESPLITEPNGEYVTSQLVDFGGTAPEQGTVTLYLGDDVVKIVPTTPLGRWTATEVAVGEQAYLVRATLTDRAGNTGLLANSVARTITVDTTPPGTAIHNPPPARGRERSVSFEFEVLQEANFDTFQCRLGPDGVFEPCSSPHRITVLQDGSYSLQVRAADKAGLVDGSPATYSWFVDSTRPDTLIPGKPQTFDRTENVRFTFESPEPGVTFECSLDNGTTYEACGRSYIPEPLSERSYTLLVRAVDSVGNVDDSPASHTWTVDDTAPGLPTVDFPAEGSQVETGLPQFRGTATGGASEVVLFVDGSERGRASVDEAGQWRFTLSESLPNGEHSVSAQALDQARNPSERTALRLFQIISPTEIDSRGGGLSCALGGGGTAPLATLALIGLALLGARRRRKQ